MEEGPRHASPLVTLTQATKTQDALHQHNLKATMTMTLLRVPIVAAALAYQASSFSPSAPCNSVARPAPSSELFSLIKGEAFGSEPLDENLGGVGLAKRSAVKISGAGSDAQELVRYDRVQLIDEGVAKSIMEKAGCQILCTGSGKELYQDPGSSNRVEDRVVRLAPHEAAKSALAAASGAALGEETKAVVFNFAGGDELILGEVLEACDMLASGLGGIPSKAKVKFNSMSFADFPSDVCTVTVVASAGKTGGLEGVDQSIARGELYVQDGKWFTVAEGDITN